MLDLQAIRKRAQTRASAATPANPANWLIQDASKAPASVANPANRLIQRLLISQLATLASVASENGPMRNLSEALAEAINRACDVRGDDGANRAGLLAECAALPPEGQADMLAHFTIEAARWVAPAPDSRVTCTTCAHYLPHRCGAHLSAGLQDRDIAPDLAMLLQHCPAWATRETP